MDCSRIFNQYVQLAMQFQEPATFPVSPPPNDITMEDLDAPIADEESPHPSAADLAFEEDRERLPGMDSDGDEIEVDLQVEIEDEDIEIASMSGSDDEDEEGDYLW